MNNESDKEKVLNNTILNTGIAKPISISKEEALNIATKQENTNMINQTKVITPTPITKEELDEQKVNELNDLMENEYIKFVDVKHSKKTYIILILVLIVIAGIIIFEILYYGGKI